jgi:protein-L-isoaspartate(D-aspartate) O-methyltransferase
MPNSRDSQVDLPDSFAERREALLETLRQEGVRDRRVLQAIRDVPREQFIAPELHAHAFDNIALPIEQGQTISQPMMVAMMTQALALTGSEQVLDIGTGSGYQTAVLAHCARAVVSIERWPHLAERAARLLGTLGYTNVEIHVGDGTLGWPPAAPYDAIIVTAAAPAMPAPLVQQMRLDGRLVIPVGQADQQDLLLVTKKAAGLESQKLGVCVFVPLIGAAAWREQFD